MLNSFMVYPKQIAIIMDGNGRWAKKRLLPRIAGYPKGVEAAKKTIKMCIEHQIEVLSLFAFSSENWVRPTTEVNFLMDLLLKLLQEEVNGLHENQIKLQVIGNIKNLPINLQKAINIATKLTCNNRKLNLNIAINYGGRWDLVQAMQNIAKRIKSSDYQIEDITEDCIASHLSLNSIPDPDLFIRTSGEQRLSNFFLWQSAYTELFFTKTLWPDFNPVDFQQALDFYSSRKRTYGAVLDLEDRINA